MANGLNLLIAAIILWNTRYLEKAFVELERQGVNVAPTIVGWEHIGLTGDYVSTDADQPSDGVHRPLRRRESMLAGCFDLGSRCRIRTMHLFPVPFMGIGAYARRCLYVNEKDFDKIPVQGQSTASICASGIT